MATKFYIKQYDTDEPLSVVIRRRQAEVDGVTPPDELWDSEKTIQDVHFSMKKVPHLQDDGSYLWPDGTIHRVDGTIYNPLGNGDIVLSNILVLEGEILREDYSVLEADGEIRHPNGLLEHTDGTFTTPDTTRLLPNGMLRFAPSNAYPEGYTYNPGSINRLNYYKVGNPTSNAPEPNGDILLPLETKITVLGVVELPQHLLRLPEGITKISDETVQFPVGTVNVESTTVKRDRGVILPKAEIIHHSLYELSFDSTSQSFEFPNGSILEHNETERTAKVIFPNATEIVVPFNTFEFDEFKYIFPYGTEYVILDKKLIFPGEVIILPLSATLNVIGLNLSVTFTSGVSIDETERTVLLTEHNQVLTDGDTLLYDSSRIKLNNNYELLSSGYIYYPRGTQKNAAATIIHPPGYRVEGSYLRYYPTRVHPVGLLMRSDGSIVNGDGSFTKLDTSVVDSNGNIIQPASTDFDLYEAPSTTPFVPTTIETSFIVVNNRVGSWEEIDYEIPQETGKYIDVKDINTNIRTVELTTIDRLDFDPPSAEYRVLFKGATLPAPLTQEFFNVKDTLDVFHTERTADIDNISSNSSNYDINLNSTITQAPITQDIMTLTATAPAGSFSIQTSNIRSIYESGSDFIVQMNDPTISPAPMSHSTIEIPQKAVSITHVVNTAAIEEVLYVAADEYSVQFKSGLNAFSSPFVELTDTSGVTHTISSLDIDTITSATPNWVITMNDAVLDPPAAATTYTINDGEHDRLLDFKYDPILITAATYLAITAAETTTYTEYTITGDEYARLLNASTVTPTPITISEDEYLNLIRTEIIPDPIVIDYDEFLRVGSIIKGESTPTLLRQAIVLRYAWFEEDTSHTGLFTGEFRITNTDSTVRTFPILKDDALLVEVVEHFSAEEDIV